MSFSLTILGNSSATPTKDRYPSSQLLNIQNQFFLIDCGEGTQMRLKHLGIKFLKIDHVFISHLHGDHFFGLVGLISTMHLFGRTKVLRIYAPLALKEIIEIQLKSSETQLNFQIDYVVLRENQQSTIFNSKNLKICSFPLKHRIPTWGFIFNEKEKPLNIKPEIIAKYHLTVEQVLEVKNGSDIEVDGEVLNNFNITYSNFKPKSFAYCSDTIFDLSIVDYIKDVDVLYHEATFLKELAHIAKEKFHSTAEEAAIIASEAKCKLLIIGHYSARYDDLTPLLSESKAIFDKTVLAETDYTFNLREII
ncbi:MAG: ribonuclease Z [Bacteroidota bacterium]